MGRLTETEPISDILKNRHRHRYFKNRKKNENRPKITEKNRYSRLFSYLPKPLFCLCLQSNVQVQQQQQQQQQLA